MRTTLLVVALAGALLACGGDDTPPPPSTVAHSVDRTPGERPAGTLAELSLDGGDAALAALIGQLPPGALRAGLPSRVATVLDGLIETPDDVRSRVSSSSPLRLVMARIDGETHSALAVRLDEALPEDLRHGDGPRGSDRVGDSAAVDERIAVVADDPVMLDRAFAYLAYVALDRPGTDGAIVVTAPASTVATTLRAGLEQAVGDRRGSLLASIAAARASHGRPPDLGDPEAVILSLSDALLARLAYLPDLGDATVTLERTPSGLALSMEAAVTDGSPLATALAERVPVAPALVAAMPTAAALVIATGATAQARAAGAGDLAVELAAVGGARVSASERERLDAASAAIAALRGDEGAVGIGANDASGFAIALTRVGAEGPAPTPWGRDFPWTTQLLGALMGCAPGAPRASSAGSPICGEIALATATGDGARADTVGRDAASLAEATRAALAGGTAPSSPDLSRDLAALPAPSFAIVLARPLRALPLLSVLSGPARTGLPRGDGAAVLAFAHEGDSLRIVLRASTAAMADLDAVVRLFAEESDSE